MFLWKSFVKTAYVWVLLCGTILETYIIIIMRPRNKRSILSICIVTSICHLNCIYSDSYPDSNIVCKWNSGLYVLFPPRHHYKLCFKSHAFWDRACHFCFIVALWNATELTVAGACHGYHSGCSRQTINDWTLMSDKMKAVSIKGSSLWPVLTTKSLPNLHSALSDCFFYIALIWRHNPFLSCDVVSEFAQFSAASVSRGLLSVCSHTHQGNKPELSQIWAEGNCI